MFLIWFSSFSSRQLMGRNRKWVLEDSIQDAVWKTILRGPASVGMRKPRRSNRSTMCSTLEELSLLMCAGANCQKIKKCSLAEKRLPPGFENSNHSVVQRKGSGQHMFKIWFRSPGYTVHLSFAQLSPSKTCVVAVSEHFLLS